MIRRNVLQAESQAASHNINDEWPFEIAIAISAHNDHARSDRPQFIKNRFRANVAKMPDFISVLGHLPHALGQTIVRVRENENMQHLCGVLVHTFQTGIWMLGS